MKVNEIFTATDAEKYIGKSKSWKKAWLASYRKWEIIEEFGGNKYNDILYNGICGFCFVNINRNTESGCGDCPVEMFCGGKNPQKILFYLRQAKKRIFALK